MITDPRTWLEVLGTEDCWNLLATTAVGRLAVVTDGRPQMFPVNYATDGRTIVFRTEAGSKLAAVDGNPNVCFEIDSLDVASRAGWSVLVAGQAATVRATHEIGHLRTLPLEF